MYNTEELSPHWILDTLKNGNKILQGKENFKFGIDAVLLADFASSQIRKNENLIDLGTGTGIIPLLLEKSSFVQHITALEIQEESFLMSKKSVELNQLEQKISVVQGDIKEVQNIFERHSFNAVTSNPPYMLCTQGKQNPNDSKAIARHEVLCTLEDVVSAADFLLKSHGRFFMIHRPERLPQIMASLVNHKLEPKQMQLIHPFAEKAPTMVMIEARKNANPGLKVLEPLVVYEKPGQYTEKVLQIYKK